MNREGAKPFALARYGKILCPVLCEAFRRTPSHALHGKKRPRTLSEPTRGTLPLDPLHPTPQPLKSLRDSLAGWQVKTITVLTIQEGRIVSVSTPYPPVPFRVRSGTVDTHDATTSYHILKCFLNCQKIISQKPLLQISV